MALLPIPSSAFIQIPPRSKEALRKFEVFDNHVIASGHHFTGEIDHGTAHILIKVLDILDARSLLLRIELSRNYEPRARAEKIKSNKPLRNDNIWVDFENPGIREIPAQTSYWGNILWAKREDEFIKEDDGYKTLTGVNNVVDIVNTDEDDSPVSTIRILNNKILDDTINSLCVVRILGPKQAR